MEGSVDEEVFETMVPGKKGKGLTGDDAYWYRSAVSAPEMIPEILAFYFNNKKKDAKIRQDLECLNEIYRQEGILPSHHLWIDGISPEQYTEADVAAVDLNLQLKSQERFKDEVGKFADALSESTVSDLYTKNVYTGRIKPENQRVISSYEDYLEIYQVLKKSHDGKIPTGYRAFDAALNGGWEKGQTYGGVAGTGVGKTTNLTNFAANALRMGFKVGYLSTEMPVEKIIERVMKSYYDKETYEAALLAMKEGANLPIGTIDIKVFGCNEITAPEVERLFAGSEIDILFVDYADELRPSAKAENAYFAYANTFKELRNVAVALDIPIVTVTQGNRGMWDKEGGTVASAGQTSVADSIAKLNGISMAWNILQPKGLAPEEHSGRGAFKIEIIKNRYGPKSSFELEFNASTCRIFEYPLSSE